MYCFFVSFFFFVYGLFLYLFYFFWLVSIFVFCKNVLCFLLILGRFWFGLGNHRGRLQIHIGVREKINAKSFDMDRNKQGLLANGQCPPNSPPNLVSSFQRQQLTLCYIQVRGKPEKNTMPTFGEFPG